MIGTLRKRKQAFEESLNDRNRQLWEVFMFLIRLLLLASPLYLLLVIEWNPIWLRELNAGISASILNLLGLSADHTGSFVITETIRLNVSVDSTGWKSFLALAALMLAVRDQGTYKRLYGVIIGWGVLFIGNILRITSMIYAVEVWGVSYEFMHTFLWRWGLTVLVLTVWILWLQWEPDEQQLRSYLPLVDAAQHS